MKCAFTFSGSYGFYFLAPHEGRTFCLVCMVFLLHEIATEAGLVWGWNDSISGKLWYNRIFGIVWLILQIYSVCTVDLANAFRNTVQSGI